MQDMGSDSSAVFERRLEVWCVRVGLSPSVSCPNASLHGLCQHQHGSVRLHLFEVLQHGHNAVAAVVQWSCTAWSPPGVQYCSHVALKHMH